MTPARTIDVSELEPHVMDHRSPIWWGNVLLLCIETTMFAIVVASYFYLRQNFESWPPPQVDKLPVQYNSAPNYGAATVNMLLLLASCVPMFLVDRAAMRRDTRIVKIGLAVCVLAGLVAIGLRFMEFSALKFRWDANAYASITWTILGLHLLHLITGTYENALMTAWVFIKGMDDKHARDIRVSAIYWYWIAAIWLPIYAIVFFGPRLF